MNLSGNCASSPRKVFTLCGLALHRFAMAAIAMLALLLVSQSLWGEGASPSDVNLLDLVSPVVETVVPPQPIDESKQNPPDPAVDPARWQVERSPQRGWSQTLDEHLSADTANSVVKPRIVSTEVEVALPDVDSRAFAVSADVVSDQRQQSPDLARWSTNPLDYGPLHQRTPGPRLFWENIEGSPLWQGFCRPKFKAKLGLHTVSLSPASRTKVLVPSDGMLRISILTESCLPRNFGSGSQMGRAYTAFRQAP